MGGLFRKVKNRVQGYTLSLGVAGWRWEWGDRLAQNQGGVDYFAVNTLESHWVSLI
jgi:hypothetical protein